MRIAIVGSGAMGGLYGAFLARAGYDVRFLMRRDYEAVKASGLTVLSCRGDFHLEHVNCYRRPEDIGIVDLVFIGLKTTANNAYQQLIAPLMGPDTRVLTAQNGLGNEESLAELFGAERVAGGLAFLCSNRKAPGVINHLDYGFLHIGNFQRGPDATLLAFSEMLNAAGVECTVVDDLALARWKKLIWNVPFNGLSALLDRMVDNIMKDAALRERAWRLMKEVQSAAGTDELTIDDGFLEHMMDLTEKMEPYYTSMHLDRQHNRPMEIESIIGEPLRRGQKHGLDLPEMQNLYTGLKEIDHAPKL
ncbi:MAG: putative 2-dehydropantoate 2-reductase [Planctomycetota bacterium]|jgi:2-dehydropantoate 2-reductase